MTTLTFSRDEVRALVLHSRAAPQQTQSSWRPPITEPSLILVKDEGCYLMSNGEPRQILPDKSGCVVAYAEGYDPTKLDRMEVWERCRADLGGDDFAEYLPATMFDSMLGNPRAKVIRVTISETQISVRQARGSRRR